jgi:hypothetical protein
MNAPGPRVVKAPIRLGKAGRMIVYVIAAGLWLSGAAWLVFHYFLRRPSDFGLEAHPLEVWWLSAHGAFGFAALWLIGFLSARHIGGGWASGRRRLSGLTLLVTAGVLTLSAWLLYYLGHDGLRGAAAILHWGVGLAAPWLFLCHRLAAPGRSAERRRRSRQVAPDADIHASTQNGTRGQRQ